MELSGEACVAAVDEAGVATIGESVEETFFVEYLIEADCV